MAKIPTTKLTREEYENLLAHNIVDYGGESLICDSDNPNTLYKIFDYSNEQQRDLAYPNKRAKIESLYDLPELLYSVRPVSILEVTDQFVGYEMTCDREEYTLADSLLSKDDKLVYLHQIKNTLAYYKTLGITYGDVRGDNILINPIRKTIRFCDMDNIKLGAYPIDVMTDVLAEYLEKRGSIDETADIFMFNLLTLEQLAYPDEEYNEIMKMVCKGIVPSNFDEKAASILHSMTTPKEFTGQTILQYVKK